MVGTLVPAWTGSSTLEPVSEVKRLDESRIFHLYVDLLSLLHGAQTLVIGAHEQYISGTEALDGAGPLN